MKNLRNKYLILLFSFLALGLMSCESFLDKQEDEQLTFDKIWESGPRTRQYWYNAMSFINSELGGILGDSNAWLGASDEATSTFNRGYRLINFGSWNPSNIPYGDEQFDHYYKGIRECNVFLQNVDRLSDPSVKQNEIDRMKIQTKFARAYYYFCMMRIYGPVFLIGDELLDFTASSSDLYRPRNTWDQCVDYVVSEMKECIASPAMQENWSGNSDKGLATKGTCQAVISRLTLYSARDLFNGNSLYSTLKNPMTDKYPELSGLNLFPVDYDSGKWLTAAKEAKEIIDMPLYKLYRAGNDNPYEDYYGVTQELWNSELIWTTGYKGRWNLSVVTTPTSLSGTAYGGIGPTQQQVDAYAMSNGKYPITGYEQNGSQPIIDTQSGYNINEFQNIKWEYPEWGGTKSYEISSPIMYSNREPRFYVNVFFGGSYWHHGPNKTLTSFAKGANGNKSHDYPKSGYLINRFYDHTSNSASGEWGNITFPTFRLAEIYLNFIEAVLECKNRAVSLPSGYEDLAFRLWDDIRDRAGVPAIREAYPNVSTDKYIQLCRQERRVELSFENHRYFDTRTWKIATQTDGGPMYGMDTTAPGQGNQTPASFWKRTVFETRVFRSNHYLHPFSQREIDRNKLLVQNYGW